MRHIDLTDTEMLDIALDLMRIECEIDGTDYCEICAEPVEYGETLCVECQIDLAIADDYQRATWR